MTIYIPNCFVPERRYVIEQLIFSMLGLECTLIPNNEVSDYKIILANGNKLIIEDHFFNRFSNDQDYLKPENVPLTINYQPQTENRFIPENDMPIIYGTDKVKAETRNQESETILTCGIDLFASAFFMLTRWEEYVKTERDEHGRFPATASLAYQNGFLHRPIVNEYIDMLWNMLEYLGVDQKRKQRETQLFLTHDVDHLYFWKGPGQLLRLMAGDVLKRRSLSQAMKRIKEYIGVRNGKLRDPFDTFDWLMEASETIGKKSRFYFMCGGQTKYDNHYSLDDERTSKLFEMIKRRGHLIGIHPSYDTYNNAELLKQEKKSLEKAAGMPIDEGRQHYLRFEVPTTWQCWEDAGMKLDSTCGYADKEGFRCGTGDTFTVFNILTRKHLKLKERPLIVMDGTLFGYQHYSEQDANSVVHALKRWPTSLTFLWHNSFFKHRSMYRKWIAQ
jgi:hypothetical protein